MERNVIGDLQGVDIMRVRVSDHPNAKITAGRHRPEKAGEPAGDMGEIRPQGQDINNAAGSPVSYIKRHQDEGLVPIGLTPLGW